MGERWGTCPSCRGNGERYYLKQGKDPTSQLKEDYDLLECGSCLGSGFDGSAEAYTMREYRFEHDREMEEINRSMDRHRY